MHRLLKKFSAFPAKFWSWCWLRLYQMLISPWLGPNCRYQPTCSAYMIESVRKYGCLRGLWRGTLRICRCHRWVRAAYDPP